VLLCPPWLPSNVLQANKNHVQDLRTAHDEYTANQTEQAARLQRAQEKAKEAEARSIAATDRATKAEVSLAEMEKEKKAVQNELDDLLMVFGDMEEKTEKYKDRLKELGENVSDGEEEDENDAEEDDDVD
jgi:chromosome segregation ATPase